MVIVSSDFLILNHKAYLPGSIQSAGLLRSVLRIPIQDLELLPLLLIVRDHFGELVELLLEVEVHELEESVPGDPRTHHIHRLILLPIKT